MKCQTLLGIVVVAAVSTAIQPAVADTGIRYVDDDAATGGDGKTWENAYKYVREALDDSVPDEIRVAQGTYRPDEDESNPTGDGDTSATFELSDNLAIYGGYRGCPTGDCDDNPYGEDPGDRDITAFETILSGDLDEDDAADFQNYDDNSKHIVTGSGTGASAVLDGFTITAGSGGAPNGGCPTPGEGGLEPPTGNGGGGLYNDGGSPTVLNCLFKLNSGWSPGGGGMLNLNSSNPTVIGCTFDGNLGRPNGGGMLNKDESSPDIINCIFDGNESCHVGGGMNSRDDCHPTMINCLLVDNTSVLSGGGVRAGALSSTTMINCTFVGNSSARGGGFSTGSDTTCSADCGDSFMHNCIFWDNDAPSGSGPQISLHGVYPGDLFVEYSDVEGGEMDVEVDTSSDPDPVLDWGDGNINEDPKFVSPGSDYRLTGSSPCKNEGLNDPVPTDVHDLDDDGNTTEKVPIDLAGKPRFVPAAGTIDMGAYEFKPGVLSLDFNGDDVVDAHDLHALLAAFGPCAPGICPFDVNADGFIDGLDVVNFVRRWRGDLVAILDQQYP